MKNFLLRITKFVFKLFTGFFILYGLYILLRHFGIIKKKSTFRKIYIKDLPFHLNPTKIYRIRIAVHFFLTILLSGIVAFVILSNIAPLGITIEYKLGDNRNISDLVPKDRVESVIVGGEKAYKQTNNLIYFTTRMPFQFDTATVKLTFKDPYPDQLISIGFQDQSNWHYSEKFFDVPFLNNLSWNRIGESPVVYQREKHFFSVKDFLANPPKDAIIGTYNYDTEIGNTFNTKIQGYKPQSTETVIDTPLRGRHILYVYLENEPFNMNIEKQDLNWYKDSDAMGVEIYKDQELVYQVSTSDDGILDASRRTNPPQIVTIKNPGPGLPETGVYKVVIDASDDTIIKRISTNLHKIVFQGSLYLSGNRSVYSPVISSTSATTVYTNALLLSAKTYHGAGIQDIKVGDKTLHVNSLASEQSSIPENNITKVTIPRNDIILNAYQGYFAFNPNQYFTPTSYHIIPVTRKEDTDMLDYLLTDYSPSQKEGAWQTKTQVFNLSTGYIKNGILSWVISAPHVKDNNRQIFIKDLDIIFHKNPWL